MVAVGEKVSRIGRVTGSQATIFELSSGACVWASGVPEQIIRALGYMPEALFALPQFNFGDETVYVAGTEVEAGYWFERTK